MSETETDQLRAESDPIWSHPERLLPHSDALPQKAEAAMLVIGTPRPSSSVLGETQGAPSFPALLTRAPLADNGFFDPALDNIDLSDLAVDDDEGDANAGRDVRSRSESFHEKFTDEGDKAVEAVQMQGQTPLHSKQMAIVAVMDSHHAQDSPESLEEQQLDALEYVTLKAWVAPGGRGKADVALPVTSSPGKRSPWARRRSSLSKTLVVHSGLTIPEPSVPRGPNSGGATDASNVRIETSLLPAYEDKLSVAVLGGSTALLDWSPVDFAVAHRRVHCEVWNVPDAFAEQFLASCDACLVDWTGDSARTTRLLQMASQARGGEVVVSLRGKGKPSAAVRQVVQQTHVSYLDFKDAIDVVVCKAVINLAKQRGDDISALNVHMKKLNHGGVCLVM